MSSNSSETAAAAAAVMEITSAASRCVVLCCVVLCCVVLLVNAAVPSVRLASTQEVLGLVRAKIVQSAKSLRERVGTTRGRP